MKAGDVLEILEVLEETSTDVWVGDGGWGVDALLGEQTRDHSDVDIIVRLADVPTIVRVLGGLGFEVREGAPPTCFVMADAGGRRVDIHPVQFRETGDAAYQMEDGRTWIYPARGFAGSGYINGRRVRCLTPDVELLCKTGYRFDADDVRDIVQLAHRFGLGLSEEQEQARVSLGLDDAPTS